MSDDDCTPISEWPPPEDDLETKKQVESGKRKSFEETPVSEPIKRIPESQADSVEVVLARWYRQHGNDLRVKYSGLLPPPGQASPKTMLALVAETKEGRSMLEAKLKEEQKTGDKNSFGHHFQVASLLDRLGQKEAALSSNWTALAIAGVDSRQLKCLPVKKYLDVVASLGQEVKQALWLQYRLQHEFSFTQNEDNSELDSAARPTLEVQERVYGYISTEEFLLHFCSARLPLLLKEVPNPTCEPWTVEYIKTVAKDCTVQVRSPVAGSAEWAGLEGGEQVKVGDLLSKGFPPPGKYLFDWSLPLHCPALAKEFIIPTLLQDNYLKQTSQAALYHQSWPSLFVARAGTNGDLHIDAFGSHFWMYMISGRKRWTFFPSEQVSNLCPMFPDTMDPVFQITPSESSSLPHYSVDLTPGKLLYVPAGCPHKVENLEDSIAVSGNFVNKSNIKEVEKHLRISAILDPRAGDLLREFADLKLVQ